MRKLILPAAILLLLGIGAAFVLLNKRAFREVRTAELLPPETVFLAEAPSLGRTALRFSGTALNALVQEPEIQAFLERPRAKLPILQGSTDWPQTLADVRPLQAFVAVTSIDAETPQVIAGFSYAGSRSAVEHALETPRTNFKNAYPAGKAELLPHGQAELIVFSDKTNVLAEASLDNWYFAANNTALLRATLDRFWAQPGAAGESLATRDSYREAMAPLPAEPELAVYLRPQPLVQRFATILKAAGQAAAGDLEKESVEGIGFASKIEGPDFHDAWFAYAPATESTATLARHALALTTPETALLMSSQLPADLGKQVEAMPMLNVVPGFADFASGKLKLGPLLDALGPEMSFLLDWPKDGTPAPAVAFDLRDAAAVREVFEAMTQPDPAAEAWTRQELQGATVYQPKGEGWLSLVTPSFGLSDRFLTLTFMDHAAAARAQHPEAGASTLATAPAYQAAAGAVQPPGEAFGFLNTGGMVGRAYGAMRPVLAMSLAFNPDVAPYVDAGKLPSPDVLSKHLGATAYSKATTAKGQLTESKGPITFNQAIVGTALIYSAAALPMLKQTLQNGGFASGLIPPVPSLPAPGAAPQPAAAGQAPPEPAAVPSKAAEPK
jgi:hypothetical protein